MLFRKPTLISGLMFCVCCGAVAGVDAPSRGGDGSDGAGVISQGDYVLQSYDLLHVVVFQEPDLENTVRLSEDGRVTLPLIGTVSLQGMDIAQARKVIRDLYDKDYLVNPQVTVTVVEFAKEAVNVLGSVNSAGSISIPPDQPLNLLDAIARAGGFSRLADRTRVKLTRATPDGQTSTVINVDDMIKARTSDKVKLKKGDMIYVPERIL